MRGSIVSCVCCRLKTVHDKEFLNAGMNSAYKITYFNLQGITNCLNLCAKIRTYLSHI